MGRGPRIVIGVATAAIAIPVVSALTNPWVGLGVALLAGWVVWRLIPAAAG